MLFQVNIKLKDQTISVWSFSLPPKIEYIGLCFNKVKIFRRDAQ